MISPYTKRIDAHINTDKVIYRPNDVMFIEILCFEAMNKTPVALNSTDEYFSYFYINVDITDPSGNVVQAN